VRRNRRGRAPWRFSATDGIASAQANGRSTRESATVLTRCILGWAFGVYEQRILQLVTPILIETIGIVTTVARWNGLIGTFVFPALADLYGRRPMLIVAILGHSVLTGLTGLTGLSTGWITLLFFTPLTRIAPSGENPVGMLMVSETAPTKWRATALGGLVGGYPFGYMLFSGRCSTLRARPHERT
jgi:MFS family permease